MSTRFSCSLVGLFLLASLAVESFVFGPSTETPQATGDWHVTATNWTRTGGEEPVPALGSILKPGQRIATANGQEIKLYVGRVRVALKPNTAVIVGDDDRGTVIGTFELVSENISVTVYKGAFATIDAPRLKATSHGEDFSIGTSDMSTKVDGLGGQVSVSSNGTTTELGPDQVAIVGPEQKPLVQWAAR